MPAKQLELGIPNPYKKLETLVRNAIIACDEELTVESVLPLIIDEVRELQKSTRDKTIEWAAERFPIAHDLMKKNMILRGKSAPELAI